MTLQAIPNRRAIIHRRALIADLETVFDTVPRDSWQADITARLKQAHKTGLTEVRRRFEGEHNGRRAARALSFLMDQLLLTLYEVVTVRLLPVANPTASERLCLVATGGYGRGELAPFSDIDLLFLVPYKATPWAESVVETILYVLWDIGLKVGYATRTAEDCVRLAREDLTIRTAFLEARCLCGDEGLYRTAAKQFVRRVMAGSGADFVEQKLAERNARHARLGDSRYVVEPNVKDGKGGLRDLQTMWWIARYLYGGADRSAAKARDVLTVSENRQFQKATRFLWSVRVALHFIAGRAEERLTFGYQRQLADLLGYQDRRGTLGVERFMKHYFLTAKQVGDLTRIFCAVLEARQQKKTLLQRFARRRHVQGFLTDGNRLTVTDENDFAQQPARMVKIFAVADKHGLDIHPDALRLIKQNLNRITGRVRRDPEANADFLSLLTSRRAAEVNLRRMNEAGVFGRFVPDFGRVVAQMQFDMYHHYTVDEHTIRAIGLVTQIEAGTLKEDHPLATEIIHKLVSRRVLYVAVLLHDVAKGRGGDHSVLGAGVAEKLCPRLGMTAAETEMVAWLVRWHLLMSATAFKRDLADPKTVQDFCERVKSPERLRLLLCLTVVDIRAVGPGVWNGWKGQLLRDLYFLAEEVLVAGHANVARGERVKAKKKALRHALSDWSEGAFAIHAERLFDAYWIAESDDILADNARLIRRTEAEGGLLGVDIQVSPAQDMTRLSVFTADHPGLFARLAGAISVAGASITGAKIHTTADGMAMDNFIVQSTDGTAFDTADLKTKLTDLVLKTLKGKVRPKERLARQSLFGDPSKSFEIAPVVLIDNKASGRSTVIEVNAKDRPGLLYDLAYCLYRLKLSIFSAHVATYGERAVDVFYVRDLVGQKISNKVRLKNIEAKLLAATVGETAGTDKTPPGGSRHGKRGSKPAQNRKTEAAE